MFRLLILIVVIFMASCAGVNEKRDDFMAECLQATTQVNCVYTDYNRAVTAMNNSVKRKHTEKLISDETKDKYKHRVIELNTLADEAYAVGDIGDIKSQRAALEVLERLLRHNLDPDEEIQL